MENKIKENFSIITNNIINDERLSFGAKGVACYLLSKPESWKFYLSDIQKHSNEGLTKIKKYIKELEDIGFLVRVKVKNEKGQFIGLDYKFNLKYDKTDSQENRQLENPTVGKPPIYNNTNISNTNINNTNLTTLLPTAKTEKSIGEIKDEIYKIFSGIYKKHTGNEYLAKSHEFVNLVKAIKMFGEETIVNKIYLFEAMCVNKNAYFTKRGFADFTLGKLVSQWNEIVADKQTFEYKSMFGEDL